MFAEEKEITVNRINSNNLVTLFIRTPYQA